MKYCTSNYQLVSIKQKVDEIRYTCANINDAINWAEEHPNQRIIVEIPSIKDTHIPTLEQLINLQESFDNIVYDFYSFSELADWGSKLKHKMYHYPISTWAVINSLKSFKVSDIVIGEPLTFELDDVKKYIKDEGFIVRVNPTKIEKPLIPADNDKGYCHFFVIPQISHLYDNYIDVFDLIDNIVPREEALVNAYLAHEFEHGIDFLIKDIDTTIPTALFDKSWGTRRATCHQVCMKDPNRCHYCQSMIKLYQSLEAKSEKI